MTTIYRAAAPRDLDDSPNTLVMGTIGGGKSLLLRARLERLDSPQPAAAAGDRS